jgi:hypothetical protein
MSMKIAALLAVSLLAACETIPPGVTAQSCRVWEHRCPTAGTVVRNTAGGTVTYADPASPGLCRWSNGRTSLYGLWMLDAGQTNSEAQAWLGALFPASSGQVARMTVVGQGADQRNLSTAMWLRQARVLGFDTVPLPTGPREAVLVEWTERGMSGNTHVQRQRRWLDTETGALIRSEGRLEFGVAHGRGVEHEWRATSITVPPGQQSRGQSSGSEWAEICRNLAAASPPPWTGSSANTP